MNAAVRLGAFAVGLVAVFGAAAWVGTSVADTTPSADDAPVHGATGATPLPGGLMVSQDGFTLDIADRSLPTGAEVPLRFRVLGPDGEPVVAYQTEHDKDLHLIVVRRDLSGFQHVHPTRDDSGTWSVGVDLGAAGDYRVFADFTPAGHAGLTLGADLAVAGEFSPRPLPAPSRTAEVDGYTVTLAGHLVAGGTSTLIFSVSRNGVPVTDLKPYLGAYGHLVALRAGDLAYLHVHPEGAPGDGVTAAGPDVAFAATAPSAGDYRLYLDFRHGNTIRTAEFTVRADAAAPAPPGADPSTAHGPGH